MARRTSTGWSPRSRRSAQGDYLFFTDWRGDPDEKMRDDGPTVSELFCAAAERGVVVKGLMWRSHLDKFAYSEEENRHLGEAIERAGGEVLLDQRVRFGGSHHQKLVVIRHPARLSATSRSPAASTCATPAATTSRTAATRRRCRCPRSTGTTRHGTTFSFGSRARCRRARHHVPGTLERSRAAGHAFADRVDCGQAARLLNPNRNSFAVADGNAGGDSVQDHGWQPEQQFVAADTRV